MSALRKRKIEQLTQQAKNITPKLEQQIRAELQTEIDNNPIYKYMNEKPTINETELKERLKQELNEKLWQYALKEFPENNEKTLAEYCKRALVTIGY